MTTSRPLVGAWLRSSFICQLWRGFSMRSSFSSFSSRCSMFFARATVRLERLAKKPLANLSPLSALPPLRKTAWPRTSSAALLSRTISSCWSV